MQGHLLNGFSPWRILNAFLVGSRTVSPRSNTPSFPKVISHLNPCSHQGTHDIKNESRRLRRSRSGYVPADGRQVPPIAAGADEPQVSQDRHGGDHQKAFAHSTSQFRIDRHPRLTLRNHHGQSSATQSSFLSLSHFLQSEIPAFTAGALSLIGGVAGFTRKGSVPSLIGGVGCAVCPLSTAHNS